MDLRRHRPPGAALGATGLTVVAGLALLLGPAAGPAAAAGPWAWPLTGPHRVVREFTAPAQPWLPGHRGVDLAGVAGETVRAVSGGTVRFAGRVAGVPVVSVTHPGGLLTTYEPVRAQVRRGQAVSLGQPLGRLVANGSHCAPQVCLHWGLRRGADYLDPLALLGLGGIRLLPVPGTARAAWLAPALGGASIGSSSVVVGWAVATTRRRRRRLPAGVASLDDVRRRRPPPDSRADPA